MKINLQVEIDGKTTEVVANAADMVAFESKYDISVAQLGQNPKMSYMLYLAWHSLHRQKQTELKFEDWLNEVDSVGAGETSPISKG